MRSLLLCLAVAMAAAFGAAGCSKKAMYARADAPVSLKLTLGYAPSPSAETYAALVDNVARRTSENPVSTFSIDVDTGSYANMRRIVSQGYLPPADAVRAEEFLNYFDYGYVPPAARETPFSVTTEVAPAPWNGQRQLMLIGIKGYDVAKSEIPPANLVFLIDTSGSMSSPDKLPLVCDAIENLLPNLRAQDRVSIVAYAGRAGLVLEPTPGDRRDRIHAALQSLRSDGSTNGSAGIALAYTMARDAFIAGGVNRVILATDGDFNVGTTSIAELKSMVAAQRKSGIALTTLGFGTGNYNDALAEQLADIGNGNHAYIDSLDEARKVLGEELSSTLLTIAKDVKIQVEFNPALVAEYRLIGYENRVLAREDFNDDQVDAGEIGAGHDVTALYEITLVDGDRSVDPLRYGETKASAANDKELAYVKLRYKHPDEDTSRLIETPVARASMQAAPSERLRFAAAVVAFADLLRSGGHVGTFGYDDVARLAKDAGGDDAHGYRRQFVELVDRAAGLAGKRVSGL